MDEMTPPETPLDGTANQRDASLAVSVCLQVIARRADFLRAARARRQGTKGMMVQARRRGEDEDTCSIRVGFTCSKKVGNAVARNRAKRRLREAARLILPTHGCPGWDYVLIGRANDTAARPFFDLQNDLIYALGKLHGDAK